MRKRLQQVVNRVLEHETMSGDGLCPIYLHRWTLLKLWGGIGVYLHHFVGDDWSRDLHDHPKRFISIGLWGRYVEETFNPGAQACPCDLKHEHVRTRVYRAPWLRTFPAEHIHRIRLIDGKPCWTLVIVLRTVRKWGFWSNGQWVPWRAYVRSDTARQRKACP